jgi:uncharacterized OsmC-like protein
LTSEATGDLEQEGDVIVLRRVHVKYRLQMDPGKREAARRAHRLHAEHCPVARSICDCVEITTSLEMADN